MTFEERENKTNFIIARVEDWDREFLIEQVQEYWLSELDRMSDAELNEEWFCYGGID